MKEGKTAVVTGGTSGIGKEIALGLAAIGCTVVLLGRDKSRCENTIQDISRRLGTGSLLSYVLVDLALQQSIRNAASELESKHGRVDILVNNAGVFKARREMTADGIEYTLAVNHLAPFLLTSLLLERLKASRARIVTTSSVAHRGAKINLDDLQFVRRRYNGIRAYGQSKLANILFTKELARRLDGSGATANCFHPGGVRTGLDRGNPLYYRLLWHIVTPFLISPEKGAETGVYLATSKDVESISGRYFVKRKEETPSQEAMDYDMAVRLWSASAGFTGL